MASNALGSLVLILLRGLGWFYYLLPRPLRGALARAGGFLLRITGLRSDVVRQNLEYAYPGESEETKKAKARVFRDAYRHLARLVFEVPMVLGPLGRYIRSNVEVRGLENLSRAKDAGNGIVFLSSHVGNWEVMAAAAGVKDLTDVMIVTKRLKPEWLHRAIETGRGRCGVGATYEPRTLKDVLAHLKRNGTVGFVLDQYAGPPVGVRVPFFGVPVGSPSVLAALAKRTGAAILPVVNYLDPEGRVIIEVEPPIAWQEDSDQTRELAINTARYVSALERHIRAHPDQWLWIHRRFKGDLGPLREDEWSGGRARR